MPQLDALHENLSGAATRHLCQRACQVYGDARYQRLATISVAHLYNLRHTQGYRQTRGHWEPTLPAAPSRLPCASHRSLKRAAPVAGCRTIKSIRVLRKDDANGRMRFYAFTETEFLARRDMAPDTDEKIFGSRQILAIARLRPSQGDALSFPLP